jgi:hypothetical protein
LIAAMICFRLLDSDNPAEPLAQAVAKVREGENPPDVYSVNPTSFRQVPNAPFAYWVSEHIRRIFTELPAFEGEERKVRQGLATADDDRFVRATWETPSNDSNQTWFPFAKGGSYSPFYADIHLKVNWSKNGGEIRFFGDPTGIRPRSRPQNTQFYFRSGLTWPLRTRAFCPQALPAGCIFSVRGYSIIAPVNDLPFILGLTSSKTFDFLFKLNLGWASRPEFIVGVLQKLPFAEEKTDISSPAKLGQTAWSLKRSTDTANQTSHAFYAPALSPSRTKPLSTHSS